MNSINIYSNILIALAQTMFETLFNTDLFNFMQTTSFSEGVAWCVWLDFSVLIFFLGISWILLNWKNFLITMLCVELMYFGVVISFIFVSLSMDDPKGQIFALIFVILAAAESAIGLGILIVLYRFGKSIDFIDYQELKG